MKCKICNETFLGHGHNAEPIANGRCCDVCNDTKVIPLRLDLMSLIQDTDKMLVGDSESPAFQMFSRLARDLGVRK